MQKRNFWTRFDPPPSVNLTFTKPSLTEQSHRKECNINCIIDRYKRTGVLGTIEQTRDMFYGDFANVGTFHEAQNLLAESREKFMALPSNVREAFGNDVTKFLDALRDNSQIGKLIDLGIVKKVAENIATPENPVDMSISPEKQAAIDNATA